MKLEDIIPVVPTDENLIPDETYLQMKFMEYHNDHPEVYELLKKYVLMAKAANRETYSINGLFERIRWHVNVDTRDEDGFKMNNNYRSRYARMLMKDNPEFVGFFEIRELKS